MDTQGIFDNDTSTRNDMMIFALSTLMSSVLIYNLQNQVKKDDLMHLKVRLREID